MARSAGAPAARLYDILPTDHRMAYDMRAVLGCVLDGGQLTEFQPEIAPELLCGHGAIEGWPVAVITNQRGLIKTGTGRPRFGGILYTESAEKGGDFLDNPSPE